MAKRHQDKIEAHVWLAQVARKRGTESTILLQTAIDTCKTASSANLDKGLSIANILLGLDLDTETLAAAIIYPAFQAHEIPLTTITEKMGANLSKLLEDVMQMQSLGKLQHIRADQHHQIENLRKLLLAMVTDVRSILIVLVERLWQLYQAKNLDEESQRKLATEISSVYAPLANRIGVWQLKWEIEDLCLRYLQPDIYKSIAKWLAVRRDEREIYIQQCIVMLSDMLKAAGIKNFDVSGRVKHIYSINAKMKRKNVDIEHVYDISALRVLVNSIEECYNILGLLHNNWQFVPEEFDDYISHPKANGYRSIHTVIIGPEERFIEVQIRTKQMHQESELGVAAHWRYKEGVLQTSSYEAKIALLRQLMAWQREVVSPGAEQDNKPDTEQDIFADQVYVFTPVGDIIDLPKGSTPLDFAYNIHSEVGHRCRGAKVDGKMVTLTYQLQTGQRVEILTAKTAHPSRDWLNPHLGYLKSPRARAKVAHWFRALDSAQQPVTPPEPQHPVAPPPPAPEVPVATEPVSHPAEVPEIQILGINNLLTHIADCCKPLPGDKIVGYITRSRGVSVHRSDCSNINNMRNTERLLEISWNKATHKHFYPTDLYLRIIDRTGLLRDITTLLASEKINIVGLQTQKIKGSHEVDIYLTIEIETRSQLSHALEVLHRIPNILEVRRR